MTTSASKKMELGPFYCREIQRTFSPSFELTYFFFMSALYECGSTTGVSLKDLLTFSGKSSHAKALLTFDRRVDALGHVLLREVKF